MWKRGRASFGWVRVGNKTLKTPFGAESPSFLEGGKKKLGEERGY